MSILGLIETIPLDKATLCETCKCITASTGHTCEYCGAPTLVSLKAILERDTNDERTYT